MATLCYRRSGGLLSAAVSRADGQTDPAEPLQQCLAGHSQCMSAYARFVGYVWTLLVVHVWDTPALASSDVAGDTDSRLALEAAYTPGFPAASPWPPMGRPLTLTSLCMLSSSFAVDGLTPAKVTRCRPWPCCVQPPLVRCPWPTLQGSCHLKVIISCGNWSNHGLPLRNGYYFMSVLYLET